MQLKLNTECRVLTVFHANNKIRRYTRLTMRVKPVQAELNAALKPIFSYIPNVYLIHDDLIIATTSIEEHLEAILEVMEVIKSQKPPLNPKKCTFGSKQIKLWGMLFSYGGVK